MSATDRGTAPQEGTAWLAQNTIPLNSLLPGVPTTDLQPLKSALDGIRIVGLGEATHGTREFFQVKHLLMAPTQGVRRPPSLPSP
ncbi:hypothetical protein [Streptomyces sp. NPDC059468]|uniref:hypothetical protein n=1 Tax=unclassified Streptomyces TaxID=2593676 RepID=UPI0036B7B75A